MNMCIKSIYRLLLFAVVFFVFVVVAAAFVVVVAVVAVAVVEIGRASGRGRVLWYWETRWSGG